MLLFFTEINIRTSSSAPTVQFLRGHTSASEANGDSSHGGTDEEKRYSQGYSRPSTSDHKSDFELMALPKKRPEPEPTYDRADEIVQAMTDTFMWRNLHYDVPAGSGESHRILNNVSGYAAPGKLTLLMGAEKVNIRTSIACIRV